MVIWQYDVYLIPKESVNLDLPASVSEMNLNASWSKTQPPSNFRDVLDAIAPEFDSLSEELRWWGSDEGNRIAVWSKEEKTVQIMVRFDLRNLEESFVKSTLDAAKAWKCLLWSPEAGLLFDPNAESLMTQLQESNAQVFLLEIIRAAQDSSTPKQEGPALVTAETMDGPESPR